jgi:poly-beta-1,6-N-acetyl-D-glucosamine N-deacetylase
MHKTFIHLATTVRWYIKRGAKELLALFLRLSGITFLIREIYCRNKAIIIHYHDPTPKTFGRHLGYICKHYNVVPLSLLVDALHSRDWTKMPPKSLIITIDDGHAGNYRLLEALKRYQVLPTIYVCSHIIGTNRRFWWKDNRITAKRKKQLKGLSNQERLRQLNQETGFFQNKEYSSRQALGIHEINQLGEYADFQSHTKYHADLTTCTDEESQLEISESRKKIEQVLGKTCEHLCYPYGKYSMREMEYAKKAGYRSARTCEFGWVGQDSDPYRLRITGVEDKASINILSAEITGVMPYYRVKKINIG